MDDIPADFPVRPIDPDTVRYVPRLEREIHVAATCGECGLSWDDEEYCPPSGRCPFEYFHEMDEDEPDDDDEDEWDLVLIDANLIRDIWAMDMTSVYRNRKISEYVRGALEMA